MNRRLHLIALLALALAFGLTLRPWAASRPGDTIQPALADGVRFETADVYIDAGAAALGAWQVDIRATVPGGSVTLVGVAGGDGPFAQPPTYDPAALQRDRIILAAYTLDQNPPAGRVRVAQVQLQVEAGGGGGGGGGGDQVVNFQATLVVAADAQAWEIAGAKVSIVGGETR